MASSINNLTALYYSQGRYKEAKPLYLGAVRIALHSLGIEHPNTQTFLKNFYEMLQAQGRCASVEEFQQYVEEQLRRTEVS